MIPKKPHELERMRSAGCIVRDVLGAIGEKIAPGITTGRLDEIAEEVILSAGAEAAFKGYLGYPAAICASANEEVVHGIPGARVLKNGDIVGIDVGVKLEGYYADAARTFAVGMIGPEDLRLLEVTRQALREGIRQAVDGKRVSDISWAIQSFVEKAGFSVVRDFVGHGIGQQLHEEPQVPNFGDPGRGPRLTEGMTLAIEPMVNAGSCEVFVASNGWTAITKDRKRSCHFEDTVIVGKKEAKVITA